LSDDDSTNENDDTVSADGPSDENVGDENVGDENVGDVNVGGDSAEAEGPTENENTDVAEAGEPTDDKVVEEGPKSQSLPEALDKFQIELPAQVVEQLDLYCRVLWEWNTKLNLTRHTDYDTFVARDVVDTLMLSELLAPDEEVLDIGSGGGVPGITLGIIRPDLSIGLAESVGKKAEVLNDIVSQVRVPQAVFAERAESLLEEFRYDALTCRAVGPLWKICKWFEPHWGAFRRLLAIKGPKWVDERKEARHRGFLNKAEMRKASEYIMPGTESRSFILKLWRKGTPEPTPEIPD
jgi:16S rRNA (guanine527-N7)-methyltransferase